MMRSVHLQKSLTPVVLVLALSACLGEVTPPSPSPSAIQTAPATTTSVPSPAVLPTTASSSATPSARPGPASEANALSWLRQNALPLLTVDSGHGFDDMLPLEPLVRPARVAALGQSASGLRELSQVRLRFVTFLIEQMAFNVVAVDLDSAEAQAIDHFVRFGNWPYSIDASNVGIWRTQEGNALIAWMRSYNLHQDTSTQLRLAGVGIRSPWLAMQLIESYVQQVDATAAQTVESAYACLTPYVDNPAAYALVPPTTQVECREQLQAVYERLQSKRQSYIAASAEEQYSEMLADAAAVLDAEEVFALGDAARNRLMAENVQRLLSEGGPNTKVLLLAHDALVGRRSSPFRTMGAYLQSQLAEQYITFGLDYYRGSFGLLPTPASALARARVAMPPDDSYERFFQLAAQPLMVVPLRSLGAPLPAWLDGAHPFRSLEDSFENGDVSHSFYAARLPEEFDAIVYLQDACAIPIGIGLDNRLANANFEDACSLVWQFDTDDPSGYESDYERQVAHTGQSSLYLKSISAAPAGRGWVEQVLRASTYLGKRVRLSGWVKAEHVEGRASLALSVNDAAGKVVAVGTMVDGPITGTHDWRRFSVVVDVPTNGETLSGGLSLEGRGTVRLDDVELEVLGPSGETPTVTGDLATARLVLAFFNAYNAGQPDAALALLDAQVLVGDCNFQMNEPISYNGKQAVAAWLRRGIADHDQFIVRAVMGADPADALRRHTVEVDFALRSSDILQRVGYPDGLTTDVSATVILTGDNKTIDSISLGPFEIHGKELRH